jgi:hypothetical protein
MTALRTTLGTAVVDEQIFPITAIRLADGKFQVHVSIIGPVELPDRSEMRVHDPDGNLVFVAPWTVSEAERRAARRARPVDVVTIVFPLRITEVAGWPR